MKEQPTGAITIEDDSLSIRGYAMLALSSGTLVLCIALAVAIWKVATGIQWALILLASGSAVQMSLVGAGIYRRHTLAGQAQLEEARGRARALACQGQAELYRAKLRERTTDEQ